MRYAILLLRAFMPVRARGCFLLGRPRRRAAAVPSVVGSAWTVWVIVDLLRGRWRGSGPAAVRGRTGAERSRLGSRARQLVGLDQPVDLRLGVGERGADVGALHRLLERRRERH